MSVNAKRDTGTMQGVNAVDCLLPEDQFVMAEQIAYQTDNKLAMMLAAHIRALASGATAWRASQQRESDLRQEMQRRNRNTSEMLAKVSKRMGKDALLLLISHAREELAGQWQVEVDDAAG